MPDVAYTTDKALSFKEIIVWPDELCAACKVVSCPLKMVLLEHGIVFISGCRVWECGLYDPDIESEHYIPEMGSPDRLDRQAEQAIKSLTEQVKYLLKRADE